MQTLTDEQVLLVSGTGDNVYKNMGKTLGGWIASGYYNAVDGVADAFEWLDSKVGDPVDLTD